MKHFKTTNLAFIASVFLSSATFAHCGSCDMDREPMEGSPITTPTWLQGYLSIQKALAKDDMTATKTAASSVLIDENSPDLSSVVQSIAHSSNIQAAREAFSQLSEIIIPILRESKMSEHLYLAHCPMAFDNKGGKWVQSDETLTNPYFGKMMLRCGSIKPLSEGHEMSDHMHHEHR